MILRLAATALLGALAGLAASIIGVPLPWMVGPLVVVGATAFAGVDLTMPSALRDWMIAVIGVLLGGAFRPGVFVHAGDWLVTLAAMVACTAVMAASGMLLMHKVFGNVPVTALFAGAPGGLSQMIALSAGTKADVRTVSVAHTVRMMLIVLIAPSILFLLYPAERAALPGTAAPLSLTDQAILLACLAAFPLARRLKLPSAPLVGPMIVSAVLHYVGLVQSDPPAVAIAAAQVVLASSVAVRFGQLDKRLLAAVLAGAVWLTAVLTAIAVAFAAILAQATDYGLPVLLLAFLPGGTSEMVLVALALDQDPAFVSSHHLLRMVLILGLAPVIARRL